MLKNEETIKTHGLWATLLAGPMWNVLFMQKGGTYEKDIHKSTEIRQIGRVSQLSFWTPISSGKRKAFNRRDHHRTRAVTQQDRLKFKREEGHISWQAVGLSDRKKHLQRAKKQRKRVLGEQHLNYKESWWQIPSWNISICPLIALSKRHVSCLVKTFEKTHVI